MAVKQCRGPCNNKRAMSLQDAQCTAPDSLATLRACGDRKLKWRLDQREGRSSFRNGKASGLLQLVSSHEFEKTTTRTCSPLLALYCSHGLLSTKWVSGVATSSSATIHLIALPSCKHSVKSSPAKIQSEEVRYRSPDVC